MPLQGKLKEMSLANLIQVNCQEVRSARLTLDHAGQEGQVFFADGQVVHATVGDRVGESAVYEMLAWDDGTFVLDRDQSTPATTIQAPWHALLLEGMKRTVERPPVARPSAAPPKKDALAQLGAIAGVNGVVIASSDGGVLGANLPDSDAAAAAALAVFIGAAAVQLGETLQLNQLAYGLVTLKNNRLLVLTHADRYIGLLLGEQGAPASVAAAASEFLKQ